MRNFDGNLNKLQILPHNIEFCYTSEQDYEMSRIIILVDIDGLKYGERLVLDGGHCSCYDFDETFWSGIVWDTEEFRKLAEEKSKAKYHAGERAFWEIVSHNV